MSNRPSKTERCRLCYSENTRKVFDAKVMHRYRISYYKCADCGLLFTERPYWLQEVYEDAISIFDTGVVARNLSISKQILVIINLIFGSQHKYLDYAGGNGLLVRLLRDKGIDYVWHDVFSDNLFSRGFEWSKNQAPEAVSAIECFEHFPDPGKSMDELFGISRNIIFTTQVLPSPVPPKEWWYYTFERGGHVAFYEERTFEYLAKKYAVNYYSLRDMHVLTEKKIPAVKVTMCSNRIISKLLFLLFEQTRESRTWPDYQHVIKERERRSG